MQAQQERKKVSITDVAKLAAVHRTTASKVLNGADVKTSEITIKKILKAAKSLGFSKPSLDFGPNNLLNFGLITNLVYNAKENPFFCDVFEGIQLEAIKQGLNVYLVNRTKSLDFMHLLGQEEFLGFISIGHINPGILSHLEFSGKPLVGIESPISLESSILYSVSTDGSKATKEAADYLIGLGFKRVYYLGFVLSDADVDMTCFERSNGVATALIEKGLYKGDHQVVVEQTAVGGEKTAALDAGYRSMKKLLSRKPETPFACICYSDVHAIGAYKAVQESGLSIPDDVSIIGHDNIELCESVKPALSTIEVPRQKLGELAVKTIMNLKHGTTDHKIIVPTKLIIRESVKFSK